MGGCGVGKTSIITRYLEEEFTTNYKPTIEDLYTRTLSLEGNQVFQLEILDTTGSNEFPVMRDMAIEQGDVFMIVFDVKESRSFQEASDIKNTII
jgi:small GTP-binding protein